MIVTIWYLLYNRNLNGVQRPLDQGTPTGWRRAGSSAMGREMGKRILVVGATGMLGEPVARRLREDGYSVRVLARQPDRAQARLGDGFEVVKGDVTDAGSLERAVEGCFGIHISLRGGPGPESFEEVEHRGTANIASAAAKAEVQRISYLSGAASFEDHAWFPSVGAKLAAEAELRKSGVPYTVFCPTHFMETLPMFVRGGRATIIGRQPHALHYVAAADMARMVSRAFAEPRTAGKRLYVFGPESMTMREALEVYCAALAPRLKISTVPTWVVGLVGRVSGNPETRFAAELFRFFERVGEGGDPTEANDLLGAPTTTLAAWCEARGGGT